MPSKLTVFNTSIGLLGQSIINDPEVTNNDTARTLRGHWTTTVNRCHEKTAWDHAKVLAQLGRLAETPTFGYDYYYAVPSDCVRTLYISETGEKNNELLEFEKIEGKIATDVETVYLTYVTKDSIEAIGRWPDTFAYYVATELAFVSAPKINPEAMEEIGRERKKALADAIGIDAAQGPVIRRRHGSWSGAARLGRVLRREHG